MNDTESNETRPDPEKASAGGTPEGREPASYGTGEPDGALNARVVDALKSVYDPEIPVNIYEMGMIYDVRADRSGSVYIRMTLTSPACPVAGSLPGEVQDKVGQLDGVAEVKVELVWDPPWTMDLISEAARLQLNI